MWLLTMRMKVALALLAVTALAFAAIAAWAYRTGYASAERKFAAERLEIAKATVKAMERRYEVEDRLRRTIDERNKSFASHSARLIAERDHALARLRDRPSRADSPDVPQGAGAGEVTASCTGASLYREDSEFLVREAARADLIRAAYERCEAQYEAVKDAINGQHKD